MHPLVKVIEEVDLAGSFWNQKHGVFKRAVDVDGLLNEVAIQQVLDVGLLRWPYFMLLKEGVQPRISDFTCVRSVGGQALPDFADAGKIRGLLAAGATMKLSQLEDWHMPTRLLMDEIESLISAELKAYVFYTPEDNTGMLPHRDPSHVLAVQIEGAKEWRIYDAPQCVDSRGGLLPDLDVESYSHRFVLEPGDVLYLPHGVPHVATAKSGTSLHLTLTLSEPAPMDLLEAVVASAADSFQDLETDSEARGLEEKASRTLALLREQLDQMSSDELVSAAVARMRYRRA